VSVRPSPCQSFFRGNSEIGSLGRAFGLRGVAMCRSMVRMFFVTILGSGSAGNCALVETPQCRLLIDGGLSSRQIVTRLALCGVNPLEIDGLLITHEHGDHTGALNVWSKQFPTPVY